MKFNELWLNLVEDLNNSVDNFLIYEGLKKVELVFDENNQKLKILTTTLIKKLLLTTYKSFFDAALNLYFPKIEVEVEVLQKLPTQQEKPKEQTQVFVQNLKSDDLQKKVEDFKEKDYLKSKEPNYYLRDLNFHNLIKHSGNENAIECGLNFISDNNKNKNIMFMYGNVGIGKTHVACALVNEFNKKNSPEKSLYIKSSVLTDLYSECVVKNNKTKTDLFLKNFKDYELLVFDDFHDFEEKENFNKAMFLIVDQLIMYGCKIIFISQVAPQNLNILNDSLKSRLSSGYLIKVKEPDDKGMEEIIKNRIEQENPNIKFDGVSLQYLIFLLGNDVRAAFGKLSTLLFSFGDTDVLTIVDKNKLDKKIQSLDIFASVKKDVKTENNSQLKFICEKLNISVDEIRGKSRKSNLVKKRNIIIYFLKKELNLSHVKIGEILNRDHSTITNSLQNVEDEMSYNKDYREYLNNLSSILNLSKT